MAENPLAIRVGEDVKALFNELAETGGFDNKGEFLNRLLLQYQLAAVKDDVDIMRPAIETVETLTGRLLEVLSGTAAAILTKDEKYRLEFENMRTQLLDDIAALEQKRADDAGRIQTLVGNVEAAEVKESEYRAKIQRLEGALNDKDALLKEYKDKADTQSKLDNLLIMLEKQNTALNSNILQ